MSWGLSLLLCATFIIATVAVLRFGWPTLRWRTYNEVHGDLRIIEIGVMLSRADMASGYAFGIFDVPARLLQGMSEAWRGRPPRSANAAATATEAPRRTGRIAAEGLHPAGGGAVACAPPMPPRAAECVVYVTLKVGNH